MEAPIELPSGRLICSPHRLTVCGKCCVDYSFMDEIIDDDNEEESNEDEDESDEDEDGSDEDEDGSDEDEDGSDEDQAPIEEEMKASREHLVIPKESTEPIELSDGRLICSPHRLTICGKCCVDYSFMDEILTDDDEEEEESDGDVPLTEEEMKAFRKRMIAKKGCACFLPFVGSGCKNCDPELKKTKETRID